MRTLRHLLDRYNQDRQIRSINAELMELDRNAVTVLPDGRVRRVPESERTTLLRQRLVHVSQTR